MWLKIACEMDPIKITKAEERRPVMGSKMCNVYKPSDRAYSKFIIYIQKSIVDIMHIYNSITDIDLQLKMEIQNSQSCMDIHDSITE